MAMKINGIGGTFPVPRVIKDYVFKPFAATMQANVAGGALKTINVKSVVDNAWVGVVQRSKQPLCNACFQKLFRKKTLAEILAEADIVVHCLEPKPNIAETALPEANTAGRDIGIDPALLFATEQSALTCTLIHELAHVGGASTDAGAARTDAHAAEATLLSCSCANQYRKEVVGSIQVIRSGGVGSRYA